MFVRFARRDRFIYNNSMVTTKHGTEWVDVLNPKAKDLEMLRKKFHIHPVILNELKEPSARSRVEAYDNYLYLIYYFPVYDPKEQTSRRTEIDFLITKNAVITAHYEPLEVLVDFAPKPSGDSLRLTYHLIEALLDFEERQLRHVREKVENVSNELFKDREKEVLRKVSRLKRDVSEYRVIVKHQGPILSSLLNRGVKFWGEDARVYLGDLIGDHLKVVNQIEAYRDAISDFEDTNNQLMSLKTNDVMKTFTTLSFLTFPFMLLAALFGMNTRDTPIVNLPGAFWIVFVFMVVAMVSLTAYFRKKDWF